jgi:hypothetical protein
MCIVLAHIVDKLMDMYGTNNVMKCVDVMVLTKALFMLMHTLYIYIYTEYIFYVIQH